MARKNLPIEQILDLETYPLDQPESAAYEHLLQTGRLALERQALFALPQLVRAEQVETMARELDDLLPLSTRYDRPRNAYVEVQPEETWPSGHPRGQKHRCAYNQVLNYQIPNDSILRQIYYWEPLAEFLRRVCGYPSFYRNECPHLALSAKIAGPGDTDGWHFDGTDVVFSLLLQAAEDGGEFEYAPYIRSPDDENYDGIERLIADPSSYALRPPMSVGTLTVFKGDLSMHRVTPVEGTRRRIVALYCYDQHAGTTFDQWYIDELKQGLPQ